MRRIIGVVGVGVIVGGVLIQAQSPATIKISIKGSNAYGTPVNAPVTTALLVSTTKWDQLSGKGPTGAVVAIGDATAVLSTAALDCSGIFTAPPPAGDGAFTIFAGAILPFPDSADWTKTALGAALADAGGADTRQPIQRFGIIVQQNGKQAFSKDAVDPKNGELVFARTAGQWTSQLSLRDSKVQVEGTVPLTAASPKRARATC